MPTAQQIEKAIAVVKDEKSFIRELLQGALNWPVPEAVEALEDISYDWTEGELRAKELSAKLVAGTVKQIRLSGDQPWGIFLLEFKNEDVFTTGRGLAGPLRAVLRGLVPSRRRAGNLPAFGRENLLFICTHQYKHYRFAYFKAPADGEKAAPLAAFGWSPGEPCRTACELNLPELEWPGKAIGNRKLEIGDWDRWAGAFDVEKVTKAFFEQYRIVFEQVEGQLKGISDKEKLRLFTQRLFNRLMFIAFIQKKGWLRIAGMEHNDYLRGLWKSYRTEISNRKSEIEDCRKENFYNLRLRRLFFHALNTPNDVNQVALGAGGMAGRKGLLQKVVGDVPYLNGGLFEFSEDGTDSEEQVGKIVVPDEAIDAILERLFGRFNFTVAESTPLDVDVAVDPEMLGKVFEELVTGRHESGSYYTPKPIVSFMCREALKGYLQSKLPGESEEGMAALVDEHKAGAIKDGEGVLNALRKVRVCDPACGSGAYLLGMMHELLDLRECLFHSDRRLDAKTIYERKLEIIQTNVYGVDIDPFATNTAMLRLWLSLAVEADQPEPLPNLDFKIGTGDSLAAPDPSGGGQLALHRTLVDQFLELKAEFLRAHGQRKRDLKSKIGDLKGKLKQWAHAQGEVDGFDWTVEFAEVFVGDGVEQTMDGKFGFVAKAKPQQEFKVNAGGSRGGGFDIVLANPPYVRMELIKDQKALLKANFGSVHAGRADLYVYFYARGIQLLTRGGVLCFISSNKWFRSDYGSKLRGHISSQCRVSCILDFGSLPVFASATAYPMIFVAQYQQEAGPLRYAAPDSLGDPYPDVLGVLRTVGRSFPASALRGSVWGFADERSSAAVTLRGVQLRDYAGDRFFRGVMSGCNEAFIIDDDFRQHLISQDRRCAEVIKPLIAGRDLRRWSVNPRDRWLLFCPWDFPLDNYPAIRSHLSRFSAELQARPDVREGRHRWWCLSRYGAGFVGDYNKPKIMFPDIANEMRFAFDRSGVYGTNTTYSIVSEDLYLLAVLNSKSVEGFYRNLCSQIRGGYLRFFTQFVEQIPIPDASSKDKAPIENLVQKCLDAKGQGCEAWEKEIDERVAGLYGL